MMAAIPRKESPPSFHRSFNAANRGSEVIPLCSYCFTTLVVCVPADVVIRM